MIGFETIFPYILFILLIKTIMFRKEEIGLFQSRRPVIFILSLIFTFIIGIELFREHILKWASMPQKIISITVLLILFICIATSLLEFTKPHVFIIAGTILFGIISATGNQTIFDSFGWYGFFLAFISWGILFGFALECMYRLFVHYSFFSEKEHDKRDYFKWGGITFILGCLTNSIFLLAYYPGVMSYDSLMQMHQVTGGFPYSNHHPWLHTMLIKGIYELGLSLFQSANKAYALYSLFSITILSFSFALAVAYLRKKGLRTIWVALLIIAYLSSPINQMYSITMWKDIPFAVSILIFIVLLCIMRDNIEENRSNKLTWTIFIPISFLICFLRGNGLYVFIGMIPFIICSFWKEKKVALLAISIVILMGYLYKGPVFDYFQVSEPDIIESLSVPAQQVAAVFYYEGAVTEEQTALLNHIVDTSGLAAAYDSSPGCSDAVKALVRATNNQVYLSQHKSDFIKLYVDMFCSNKRIYVKAFIDETCGYWYHRVYSPSLWATYVEANGMGIDRDSKLSDSIVSFLSHYLNTYENLFNQYCSIGFFVYAFGASMIIALQRKSRYIISYFPLLGIWGTLLLATPVCSDMRYAYAIYIALPFLLCLSTKNTRVTPASIANTEIQSSL